MAGKRETMKAIKDELERVQTEIQRLRIEEETLKRLLTSLGEHEEPSSKTIRRRASNVKPFVLQIMEKAGVTGATSSEVAARVQEKMPNVNRDSVSSILSRLKSDGALVYNGERYFDKRYAPQDDDPLPTLKAVQ